MSERMLLDLQREYQDDGVQFVLEDRTSDYLYLQAYCDSCGDSESGFGREVGVTLTRDQGEKLLVFLVEWLSPQPIAVDKDGTEAPQDKKEGR